jgi:DNA modification methylase|tara:strand:+ start:8206 stop:9699 length:1494 start_codon:yes stop_codon:yes gene_type:complete
MKNGERCMGNSKLINGDCLEELKKLKDNSVDLLCTDPPYGYGFMGKHWDTFQEKKSTKSQSVGWMSPGMTKSTYGMNEFFVPIWEEALRVVKPGGFAFVMSAPRSDVQTVMVQTLQKAGFDVSFTPIYWTYATGFPKAMNIQKAAAKRGDIDKAKELDGSYAGYQPKPAVEVVIVAMKPLEQKGYLDQALDNQKGITWLDSCRIPFAGMSDEDQFDKDNVAGMMNFDGRYEKDSGKMYEGGWDKPARKSKSDYEKYVSDKNNKENYSEERGWDKWGEEDFGETRNAQNFTTEDTYERVSAFGDSSQSETKDGRNLWGKKATKKVKITKRKPREEDAVFKTSGFENEDNNIAEASPLGRFAANLLVSDDTLEEDFSRYYSLDAWWEDRLQKLPNEVKRTFPFLIVPKASKSEKNSGLENNIHPTVKPVTLMSYLVTLGSRKNDVVLDPFSGSGTTGIACVFSERNYILIEREKEYFKILKARIKKAKNPAGIVQHKWF